MNFWLLRGQVGKRDREFGINMCTQLYFKMDNQQGTVQHMELCSMSCGSLSMRGVGGEWIHTYVWMNHCVVHLKLS